MKKEVIIAVKKTLYSLMLNDEVVREVDALAHRLGTNRSNLINEILAEYVNYTTPERRINDILSAIQEMMLPSGERFAVSQELAGIQIQAHHQVRGGAVQGRRGDHRLAVGAVSDPVAGADCVHDGFLPSLEADRKRASCAAAQRESGLRPV